MTDTDKVRAAAAQEVLSHAQGGDTHYRHWTGRCKYTDGIKMLADAADAYWLIDVIVSHQPAVLRKIAKAGDRNFQVWKLIVRPDHSAVVTCDDGNGNVYKTQRIEYTDFPLPEVKLYVEDGVLLLPGER